MSKPALITFSPLSDADFPLIWPMMEPIIREGHTYALPRDMTAPAACAHWFRPGNQVFTAQLDGALAGTFYLRPNFPGGGSHVANAGFMVDARARGNGVAHAMCAEVKRLARLQGFEAMQFNFVVSTNSAAVHVWMKNGFREIGRVPGGYQHADLGRVDVLILYCAL